MSTLKQFIVVNTKKIIHISCPLQITRLSKYRVKFPFYHKIGFSGKEKQIANIIAIRPGIIKRKLFKLL